MDSSRCRVLAFLILAGLVAFQGACVSRSDPTFGVRIHTYLGYGVDTFAGTASKDMIQRPDTTIPLQLTGEELKVIRKKIVAARFFELPDTVMRGVSTAEPGRAGPLEQVEVRMGHKTKIVTVRALMARDRRPDGSAPGWDRGNPDADRVRRVRKLIGDIMAIVAARPEYMALPRGEGVYL